MENSAENGSTQDEAVSLFEGMDFVSPMSFEPVADEIGDEKPSNDVPADKSTAASVPPVTVSGAVQNASRDPISDSDQVAGHDAPAKEASEEASAVSAPRISSQSSLADLQKSYPSGSAVLSGPLDEGMFSGLSVSNEEETADQSAQNDETERKAPKLLESSANGEGLASSLMESVKEKTGLATAVVGAAAVVPSTSNETLPRGTSESSLDSRGTDDSLASSSKDGPMSAIGINQIGIPSTNNGPPSGTSIRPQVIRKKKRTLRVGYARDADEADETGQSKPAMSADSPAIGSLDLNSLYGTGQLPPGTAPSAEMAAGLNAEAPTNEKAGLEGMAKETGGGKTGEGVPVDESKVAETSPSSQSEPEGQGQTETKDACLGRALDKAASKAVSEPVPEAEARAVDAGLEENTGGDGAMERVEGEGAESANDEVPGGALREEVAADGTGGEVGGTTEATDPEDLGMDEDGVERQPSLEIEPAAGDGLDPKTLEGLPLEARIEAIRKGVQARVAALKSRAGAVVTERQLAVQQRRRAAQRSLAAAAAVRELEAKLAEACEREDFDAADALSQQVGDAEKAAEGARAEARAAEEACQLAVAKAQENEEAEVEVALLGASLLKAVQEEASLQARRIQEDALAGAAAELEKLTGEEEAMETKRRKVALELRVMEEETMEVVKKVEESTQAERREREGLVLERKKLESAWEELLRQVAIKEAEMAAQDEKIRAVDHKIDVVAAKFEKLRADLAEEGARVERARAEVEASARKIEEERRRVEEGRAGAEARGKELAGVAEVAGREAMEWEVAAAGRKAMAAAAAALRETMGQLARRERTAAEEGVAVRRQTTALRAALQELAAQRTKVQQDMAGAQQRVAFAEKRGPELDAEKRSAAGARNFKEAARLAAEAKLLANDKEAAAAALASLVTELETIEKDERGKAAEVAELEEVVGRSEKRAAMARCERLRLVAVAARREMEAAAEVEEFEEAESLHMEAEAADEEAEALQTAHGLVGKQYEKVEEGVAVPTLGDASSLGGSSLGASSSLGDGSGLEVRREEERLEGGAEG